MIREYFENGGKFTKWVENSGGKGELVVTINFSFSRSVFKTLLLQICKKQGLFGKALNKIIILVI